MKVDWDPGKAADNFAKHGVSFQEATDVLQDPYAWTAEDSHDSEERFVTVGYSFRQRVLCVVWCERHAGDITRIISARKATTHERRKYDERRL